MPKLLMLRGLPGSGKSTFARELVDKQQYVRVNKDDLRAMLDNGKHSKFREHFVLTIRDDIVYESLIRGRNVVIDDTNINPKHEIALRELVIKLLPGITVDCVIENKFLHVPIETCIEQDLKRPNSVGEKVIRRMDKEARGFYPELYPVEAQPIPPAYNPELANAIIVDLDGTAALLNGRNPYDASTCEQDLVNRAVQDIIFRYLHEQVAVIFVSGREDKYRTPTVLWLMKSMGIDNYRLYMRQSGDQRKDSIVKQEIYDNYIKGKYNVNFVLDDRDQVVKMWRDNGLTCLQCNYGDF